ncbi:MAG TPA: transcriptional repressor [Candidatus Aminicenantes bacterium]|nr:transcriptional repressor [Candidatus Aminicenantes bacterium]
MHRRHQWQHRFRNNVCRWTIPREAILDLLSRSSGHMSAKEIYGALSSEYPGLGLTTVYRTLELLHRMGFVQKINTGDGQGRYQLRNEGCEDHHHHLICTECGKVIDYRDFVQEELELVKKTEETLAKKYGFLIKDHNIEFLGLCEKCR